MEIAEEKEGRRGGQCHDTHVLLHTDTYGETTRTKERTKKKKKKEER